MVPVASNTVFTFWESSEFVARDQKPTCNSGDLVRIEDTYNFQACFTAEIEHTEEEENGVVCVRCSSYFQKYEQAISPCLADNDDLKEVYTDEYNEWVTTCPCYIAGRDGKPDCTGCVLSLLVVLVLVAVLLLLLLQLDSSPLLVKPACSHCLSRQSLMCQKIFASLASL